MSALSAALCRRGIILWLAAVLLLASRSTHSAPVYDQDSTQVAEYDGAAGCYFNFQRYQEGDRIVTSEPCLNCTCHNRMLMCYLKVCPFTKAIGQDCTVEKRPDQCCPVITCLEVPVQLLTSTTSAPADSTAVGFHDNYGCHVDEKFYPDGAMLPVEHHNPCELCYCIRNRTTCVMQECTLQVAGCKPVYQPGVCCPIKYNCEYDEELSTTVGPTPGLITTTPPPGASSQCYHEDKVYEDGDLIYSDQPCEHCYCFRGEIACAVQNCGTPMQAHGKNCTALPPPEGECCPTTYECEKEQEITLPEEAEEQLPGQVPHELLTTESPMLIDEEDQQVKKHPEEETFPGAENVISHEGEEEENIQGTIEHVTQEHISSTEKFEEQPATSPTEEKAVSETETIAIEKESSPSPTEMISEEAITTKVPSDAEATKMEAPTTVQKIEESITTEAPAVELPEASSISEGLGSEEETVTTEHIPEEHVSTEESVVEKEQSIEPAISEETQTESVKPEETTSPHKELPAEVTEAEKTTEKGQVSVTEAPERPEISTEIVEKVTLPVVEVEQPDISTVPESITEKTKESEDEVETTSSEILATETEAPKVITSIPHEESSTEEITTEKEISHLTEIAVTEEIQSTEVSLPTKHPAEKEQKPMVSEGEEEHWPEEPTSEHAIIEKEQATVGAKKEDSGLTEGPTMGEEHITTEGQQVEESTPEIPAQGPSSIPIPERSPEQKAEDKNVYHVTEDSHDITHPEIISPDNLITEHPQEVPTTYIPQEQETTLALSEETSKPSAEETEVAEEESPKQYPKEVTEINLPSQHKPDITTSSKETKAESTSAVTEIQTSTEPSVTTHIPEEKASEETEKPSVLKEIETEIQSTEETFTEELPTKELGIEESGSFEQISGEKEVQPKKEQSNEEEIETQPPIITEPEISTSIPVENEYSMPPEISTSIPVEHEHSVPPSLEDEQTTKGEHITIIPEQSTVPQIGEVETEITLAEKEKSIEEHVTEQPAILPDITEEENETQTEKSISKEVETTVAIKMTEEAEEKPTTQTSVEKEKTEQPEQYSTDKISEEAATIESHGVQQTEAPVIEKKPEAVEGTEGVSTENIELQTEVIITEKEPSEEEKPSEETIRVTPTEVTTETIEQTELPHPIETSEAEKESEEKISVSTEEVQTEIPVVEIKSTESPAVEETEKIQTEPSVTEEYIPSQPSIPSDRKEDQESVELKPSEEKLEGEEQITQEPSLEEKKETETYEEPQKTTIPSEEAVTESVLPEEKLTKVTDTTTLVETGEAVTQPAVQEQPEVASEQPENVTTEISKQEEQTQGPITEEQPEIHVRKETEAPISVIHEGTSVTPTSAGEEDVSKSIETASEDSTTLGFIEKSTKYEGEVPIETENIPSTEPVFSESETVSSEEIQPEIVPSTESASSVSESISMEERQPEIIPSTESSKSESVSSEESQPETHEQTTQSLITEEESSQKGGEEFTEISTKESAILETPKVPVLTEVQPQKPEEKEVVSTEPPIHEKQEESTTVALKETPEIQITTEVPLEKIPQYSTETSISEETPIEKESTSESASRPSGIPGEGNCLIEGQSYSNNSAVPPANACQTSCRCISSIVQCELVQCPAPPAHLSNCMPVYTSGESCCPMYACDSTPTAELESDSHVIEPHIPEVEEDQKTSLPAEISTEQPAIEVTEAAKEYSTLAGETSMPETHPAEVTIPSVSPSEEELELITEKQQTTLKSVEPVYEQPTTIAQSIEQQPEEHTISSVPEIAQESASQVSEEEHYTMLPGEITEGKISEKEESVTESAISTQQPQEETVEEQTPVSGEEQQVITSTHISAEDKIHGEEEEITIPTVTEEKKISVPVEVEEISTSTEKEEEITTIGVGKEEEITTIKEKSSEEESVKEQSTLKSIEEGDKEQSEEEKIPTSEKSIIDEEEPSTKPEVSEEQKTVEPTEYESTSIPEIQFTTEHKFESETGYEKEKEHEIATSTESEQVTQSEEPESQTKLPDIVETHEPIAPVAESTTLIHDHTMNEEVSLEEHATIKSIEVSTEESKEEIKPEFLTKVPEIEHVTLPIASVETEITTEQELEKSNEETAKPVEEFTTEISHEETLPETTESTTGKESIEHAEEHTEPSEKEKESSVTILPEEKPSVTESPISTEQPIRVETSKEEAEHEKPTEPSIVHEPESTQISTEQHPEAEIESHTSELPVEEHTITEEISTTSISTEKEASEQPVTSIKEIQTSLDEVGTKQPIVPETESETPTVEEEHITIPIEEHTTKSEEHLVEEQTVISEGEATESGISTAEITESVTSQEEQIGTEKTIESAKPETELPSLTEHTIIPEIYKEKEEQKPEVGITKETDKEESVTEKAIKEETATSADLTEKYPAIEEHTEQEVEIKTHAPMELETTIAPKEQKPEKETTSEPERPLSEEATTRPSLIPEEHSISAEADEKEKDTHKPEYQTTVSITEEETSKPVTETSDVEKLSTEEESATTESATEKPEESITKVSVEISTTEKFAEVPSETEKPAVPEQETELPEQQQGETTTKSIEDAVTEEKLPEEIIPVEVIPETEEKPSEISTVSDEEAHSTESSLPIETTSIHEEEQPSISKLQPTERPLPPEEETLVTEEIQPSKPEEGEVQPGISEEPQPTTEHALETSVPIKTEEQPETNRPEVSLEAAVPTEEPTTVSGVLTELPEEKTTIGSISSEETETQGPIRPEEGAQSAETPIEHVTKTQPVSTELPIGESTEEISDEEIVHSQEIEEVSHPHFDHFPEATVKPETDYSAEGGLTLGSDEEHLRPVNHTVESERPYHEHRPATTLAPHIPEYSDQSGEDYPHFPPQSGSLNPDEDYDEDEQIYGPGTCRYGGKVYVSAQQIPRDDPCDFCFCFRSDIICLQQSCPPPIPGCHEEPISGFCCPRYECPVSMAMSLNLTTTTTTTTTTLPPHFHAHAYKGAAKRSGCQIRGQAYRVGEVIKSTSGPCLHCTCGGDGNMKCEPRMCSPEPMLRQMIATAAAKRRR
ncbi:titin [Cataglyphis hispanica]|uniref:titin n=1 Tax=Cataglyphis hispanica TaxID=1086592 RepID=UPI0021800875|nr:titin [Cataglyphis hispanica]